MFYEDVLAYAKASAEERFAFRKKLSLYEMQVVNDAYRAPALNEQTLAELKVLASVDAMPQAVENLVYWANSKATVPGIARAPEVLALARALSDVRLLFQALQREVEARESEVATYQSALFMLAADIQDMRR